VAQEENVKKDDAKAQMDETIMELQEQLEQAKDKHKVDEVARKTSKKIRRWPRWTKLQNAKAPMYQEMNSTVDASDDESDDKSFSSAESFKSKSSKEEVTLISPAIRGPCHHRASDDFTQQQSYNVASCQGQGQRRHRPII
jgi:hypothetical protein